MINNAKRERRVIKKILTKNIRAIVVNLPILLQRDDRLCILALPNYTEEKKMQRTHCRLFRVMRMVGLQRIKKALQPLCSRIWFQLQQQHVHIQPRTHTHMTRLCTYEAGYRYRIRCSHALSTDPPLSAPSYATSRDRISICCAYMYIAVRKSARIVPLDQQSVFDGSYSSLPVTSRSIHPPPSFLFFFYTYHRWTAALCFVSLRTGSKFINHR